MSVVFILKLKCVLHSVGYFVLDHLDQSVSSWCSSFLSIFYLDTKFKSINVPPVITPRLTPMVGKKIINNIEKKKLR